MTRTIATLFWLVMALLAAPAGAQHLSVEPVIAADARPGAPVDVALVFRPEPGWHGYWGENPGDAGFPPKLRWTAPAGTEIGAARWPVPTTLMVGGLMNYVYTAPFAALLRVTLPAGQSARSLAVRLSYLVCTDAICVPEEQDVSFANARTEALDGWRAALPKPLGARATYQVTGGQARIAVPYPADAPLADAYLFPVTREALAYAAPQRVRRDGDRVVIETRGQPSGPIEGVLRVGPGRGLRLTAVPGVVRAGEGWAAKALAAFALAVLGGLILNGMPCVFPILSLKALSLARSGESARAARVEALAYTAGVVTVCVALGAVLLGLRAVGVSAGWAFQLQQPWLVVLLMLLSVGIAFNLAGLFELPTPPLGSLADRGGAFATGALTAVVATPCTGPFMGAALGAALVLPAAAGLAVFAGLGLGLALPFLAIGFVPALRARLPRPGAWMAGARRLLSLPMFLTGVALAWLLGRQAGVDALGYGLVVAFALAVVLWGAGRRQARGLGLGVVAPAMLLVVAVAGAWLVERVRVAPGAVARTAGEEAFSEARLAQLRAARTPVFAYFTADWCLTCKVNERVAIEPSRVALRRKGVAVLVGDWTDGDPGLGRFIEAHGRAGVPLYLYYAPGREARVLPQVLTPGMVAGL